MGTTCDVPQTSEIRSDCGEPRAAGAARYLVLAFLQRCALHGPCRPCTSLVALWLLETVSCGCGCLFQPYHCCWACVSSKRLPARLPALCKAFRSQGLS